LHVQIGQSVLLQTEDAFGGQIRTEKNSIETLDWTKVDGATGPVYIDNAEPGDTLVVDIADVSTENKGIIATIPRYGILAEKQFRPAAKEVDICRGSIIFDKNVSLPARPMIGTIGVAPERTMPTGTLGRHGGNMDVKEMVAGVKLYLPVFVEGALFAAGDLHAVQADGELCVSAIEAAGQIQVVFNLIKKRQAAWPVLETETHFSILACGDTLEEAAQFAAEAATQALMKKHNWTFEKAYMFASLAVDLQINQVVDPKKGVRATVSKEFLTLDSLLTEEHF
jgi:amidase